MSPLDRYQILLQQGVVLPDPGQLAAAESLQDLHEKLHKHLKTAQSGVLTLRRLLGRKPEPPRGLYLWGGVGRGKTFLMDIFFECLATEHKHRTHFHRFMQRIHRRLGELQGTPDPLDSIGQELAEEYRVLCLDEFFVMDIGDAMLLAGLLRSLFAHGLVLVTTSNFPPEE
ncbi:MAG: cell division protein ZapE, partial [Gammaproteobacteria bacterium]